MKNASPRERHNTALYRKVVGAAVRRVRKRHGATQAAVAEALGLTTQTSVSRIENGVLSLTLEQFSSVCAAFGEKPHEVMREIEGAIVALRALGFREEADFLPSIEAVVEQALDAAPGQESP